jgi:hypothetical protein
VIGVAASLQAAVSSRSLRARAHSGEIRNELFTFGV